MPSTYCITPQQTLSVAREDGLGDEQLSLSDVAILTFSKAIMGRLEELCDLEEAGWISARHHPYSPVHVLKRGQYRGLAVTAIVPPMGASPLACVVEDLVACGVRAVFLVCAAWSLGPPVRFGDLVVPAFSVGPDGTSIHYGNTAGHVLADPQVVEIMAEVSREHRARVHVGGNATCEALYRITPQMVADFRERGCVCMENGEASTLFAMTRSLGIPGGALFQPYIELQEGWNPARLDGTFQATCRVQAEVALEAGLRVIEG